MSEAWITWMIQGLTGLAIGVISYYMKRDRDALDRKIEQDREALEQQIDKQGVRTKQDIDMLGRKIEQDGEALEQRIDKQCDRINQLEKDMKQMPFVYATREEFIRAVTSLESKITATENKLDSKLDKVLDRIASIKEEA